jgi:hypothetical protein
MKFGKKVLFVFLVLFGQAAHGQDMSSPVDSLRPGRQQEIDFYRKQRDIIDLMMLLVQRDPDTRLKDYGTLDTRLKISVGPILEYTLATGFTGGLASNGAFLSSPDSLTKVSSILLEIKYTQKSQFLLPLESSVWFPGNRYLLQGDLRYLNFPQDTYGFGGHTTEADVYTVTYKYIRFYESLYRKLAGNFYAGLGYQVDHHWGIKELDVPAGKLTDFSKYGYSKNSTSSGIALNLLYDARKNSINPEGGAFYANLQFLQNLRALGSNSNWNSLLFDVRKYIQLSRHKVLALWSYTVWTLSGNPPYLDLPGTGQDTYNNTGRGYEEGRFIGRRMVDLEAELRFRISSNGLVGGVVFVNAESLSELGSNKFDVISPGFGIGLRIKFNKFSNTNVSLDYGAGRSGSHGFFGNLGEVF